MKGCLPIPDDKMPAVLASCRGRYVLRDRALFVIGIHTGFRIGELLSLRIGDVVREGRWLSAITVQRRHMKGGRRTDARVETRWAPMHPDIPQVLTPWLKTLRRAGVMRREDYLFQSRSAGNRAMSRRQALRVIKSACARAGLVEGMGTHTLRKTFAEAMRRRFKGNIFLVAEAMGQKDVNSAKAYLAFSREEIDRAILERKSVLNENA